MHAVRRSSERVDATAEVFTPTELVVLMLERVGIDALGPGRTVLDPACGDGQFLAAAKWVKVIAHGMSENDALEDIYGIDIMRDNVDLCRKRLGGGTILMGDALAPETRLEGQTQFEHAQMRDIFSLSSVTELPRPARKPLPARDRRAA